MEGFTEKTFTTQQAADMLRVHKNTLLNWIRLGKIRDVARNPKNYRIWTLKDIQAAKKIRRKEKQLELEL